VLQSGRKAAADTVQVALHARLTEVGTLDLWCGEVKGDRTWRLQFDVRAAVRSDAAPHEGAAEAEGFVDEAILSACADLIRASFRKNAAGVTDRPEGLVKRLEAATAMTRLEWPSSLMRRFWEVLMEVEDGRKLGVEYETRWLNLLGFSLRPGYGLAADDWRVAQTWRLFAKKLNHPRNESARAEWWVLWRRVAGGLSAGQQQTLAEPLLAMLRLRARKPGWGTKDRDALFQFGLHETAEVWRTFGSMELLKVATKIELASLLFELLPREKSEPVREATMWALGRLGTRVPVYGPLNALVPVDQIEPWAGRVMATENPPPNAAFCLVQWTRRTGDRYRDVGDDLRATVLRWLEAHSAPAPFVRLVREGGRLEAEEQRAVFGESLPRGLRIE
jgi:hypothetical protein